MKSWYLIGEEGARVADAYDEQRAKEAQRNVDPRRNRFWLPPNKTAKIVFLDKIGFFVKEHNFKRDGHFRNWETCISELSDEGCPLCEIGNKFNWVAVSTIIDLTPFTTKDGRVIKASKKLIVLKGTPRKKFLKRQANLGGDLTGHVFAVTRYGPKDPATGDDIEYIKKIDLNSLKKVAPPDVDFEEWIKPYDYKEIFKPKTAQELRRILGLQDPIGSNASPDPFEGLNEEESGGLDDVLDEIQKENSPSENTQPEKSEEDERAKEIEELVGDDFEDDVPF